MLDQSTNSLKPFSHFTFLSQTGLKKSSGREPASWDPPIPPCPPQTDCWAVIPVGELGEPETRMTLDCHRGLCSNFPEWVLSG